MNLEEALIRYVRERPGLHRLFDGWICQYERLGHLGGSVRIEQPSESEREALGTFLGQDLRHVKQIRIRYAQFEKAVENSRFAGCDLLKALTLYNGSRPLVWKTAQRVAASRERREKIDQFLCEKGNEQLKRWHEESQGNDPLLAKTIERQIKKDPEGMRVLARAMEELPLPEGTGESLSLFAGRLSKDPHFFDHGIYARLLLKGICFLMHRQEEGDLLENNHTLFEAGLLKEELANSCQICHINACTGQMTHPGWDGFWQRYEAWNVSLYNLREITSLTTAIDTVIIVENPSIFRALSQWGKVHAAATIGFVCTAGQLNVCGYVLLDLIEKAGFQMFYAGDFDPEGLCIAQRLKERYPTLILWHYQVRDYERCRSQKTIRDSRLSMLAQVTHEELVPIKERLLIEKKSGYQEQLLEDYCKDLCAWIKQ